MWPFGRAVYCLGLLETHHYVVPMTLALTPIRILIPIQNPNLIPMPYPLRQPLAITILPRIPASRPKLQTHLRIRMPRIREKPPSGPWPALRILPPMTQRQLRNHRITMSQLVRLLPPTTRPQGWSQRFPRSLPSRLLRSLL